MLDIIKSRDSIHAVWQLMRMDKPIGWLLLLWPTLWALWLASSGFPGFKMLSIFVFGVLTMRAAGCIVNDLADRSFDGLVKRTQHRPLVTGRVDPRVAISIAVLLLCFAFILVLQLNVYTIALSFIAVALALIYPFLKRITNLPQIWLGLAFSWGIPMAFSAVQNDIPWQGWWLFVTTLIWVVAYDGMYAMVDRDDDLKIGVKSIAILCGQHDVGVFIGLQVLVLLSLALFGWVSEFTMPYYVGLIIAASLVRYQYRLIRERERTACFKAFLSNHWFGLVMFLGIVLS